MFSKKEGSYIRKLLKTNMDEIREQLSLAECEGEQRNALENELIASVSIYNKVKKDMQRFNENKACEQKAPKCLLVDDVDTMREVAIRLLKELGFSDVHQASSAEVALVMIDKANQEQKPFNIVITDWEMEQKSGLDLLKEIRLDKQCYNTDVYILSSHSEQEYILKAIETGVTGYLLKPLNFNMLQTKFNHYLN